LLIQNKDSTDSRSRGASNISNRGGRGGADRYGRGGPGRSAYFNSNGMRMLQFNLLQLIIYLVCN
jgi:hypothetical protein